MLPRFFAHWRYLFPAAVQLVALFVRAALFSKKRLPSLFGPDLPRLHPNRLRHYFFGTIFLGAVFGRLRGRALDGTEMQRFANLAALAGFFDDLVEVGPTPTPSPRGEGGLPSIILESSVEGTQFGINFQSRIKPPPITMDTPDINVTQFEGITQSGIKPPSPLGEGMGVGPTLLRAGLYKTPPQNPPHQFLSRPLPTLESYGRTADPSGLALKLLCQTTTDLPPVHTPLFHLCLLRVFHLETQACQRSTEPPTVSEIAHITASKGGYSVLLFRCLLSDPLPDAERLALFEFGHLVQLCDDIFDLWHDRQNGTATLATFGADVGDCAQLEQAFERQAARVVEVFREIQAPVNRRETALRTVLFLVAVTGVCLGHYRHLQKKHGTLPLDDRRALVVDMARWKFRWRVAVALWKPVPSNVTSDQNSKIKP